MATLKNTNDLLSQAASTLPDNSTQEISPQDVREMAENTAFSSYNKVTDEPIVGLSEYNGAFVYPLGKAVIFEGDVYQANTTTTPGTFTPSEWDLISSGGGSENLETQSTGIKSGGLLSINGGDNTRFDLAAGEAIIIDNSDLTNVTKSHVVWTAQTALIAGNLATEPRTNVGISLNNNPVPNVTYTNSFNATVNGTTQLIFIAEKSTDDFNSAERRLFANIGRLVHTAGTSITNAVNLQQTVNSPLSSVLDFINLFPAQNVEGNEFSGNALALSVAKTAGKGFRFGSNYENDTNDPNTQDIPAANPTTHFYRYQDGAGGFSQSASSNFLDPANYDDGTGTLASVAPNRWTVQPVWVFAGSGTMFVQYGQTEYSSKEAAISAIPTASPVLDDNLVTDAVFRGYFIIKQGATDLSLTTEFEWRAPLGEIGGGQGAGVVVDLQQAYNASIDPEITTDSTRGALTIKRGSAADTDAVLEIQNGAGSNTLSITGDGTFNLGVNTNFELNGNLLTIRDQTNETVLNMVASQSTDYIETRYGFGGNYMSLSLYGSGVRSDLANKAMLIGRTNHGPLVILNKATSDAAEIWFNISNGSSSDGLTTKRRMFVSNTTVAAHNISNFIVDPNNTATPTAIGSEVISLQDRTAIFGTNTLGGVNDVTLELYDGDTTPALTWQFRNNGDVYATLMTLVSTGEVSIGSGALGFGTGISIGTNAGTAQTGAAINNTFIGKDSGLSTTTGQHNTALGKDSFRLGTTGTYNIAIGVDVMSNAAVTGSHNIGLGFSSMDDMTSGSDNTGFGQFSGSNITTGSQNTCIGAFAGSTGLVSGSRNVFLGYSAGRRETGDDKFFVDNRVRTDEATARIESLLYGEMAAAISSQRLTINGRGRLQPMSATDAAVLTAANGDFIYVNTTDATFTSVGFWGYENGAWVKL